MKRLRDIKGERALEILADIIDPATEIASDEDFVQLYKSGVPRLKLVQYVLREFKTQVITILALLEDQDPKKYEPNLMTVPTKIMEILDDPDMEMLFMPQGQMEIESSGSATENTKAKGK